MKSRFTIGALLTIVLLLAWQCSYTSIQPSHPRPYFMPQSEKARIKDLVSREAWAETEFQRVKKQSKSDGYLAAFLYALEGDTRHLQTAKKYLLEYADKGGDLGRKRSKLLNDDSFFKAGQPWLGDVYYNLDIKPLVAYDWVYAGLKEEERNNIEEGILTSARFRIRAMDRWSQTANLMFKPTFMVAMAGLVTQNQEAIQWGFYRLSLSGRGGYFSALNFMLRGGGPWHEAPIYPIAQKGLWAISIMSRYLNFYNGEDWFAHKMPFGGSPKGLADYYLDTAYPIEETGYGAGQIRVATYGDGSTGPGYSDLFLVNPAGNGLNGEDALIAAYNSSADPRYASLLSLIRAYKPNLWEKPPLPEKTDLPPARSHVWPDYGLAMLRSDESPAYWTSGNSIAVFQIMSQGYGHDHRDKFSIMLHGAGRLLYPDYNAIQYENSSIGWSRNSVSHNTVIVDEQDTKNATPTDIRHDFSDQVKFLSTSASNVFDGVDQTRALVLTKDYLLDLFKLSSELPHTYDYLIQAFGEVQAAPKAGFKPSGAPGKRFWLVEDWQAIKTDQQWSLDFTQQDHPGSLGGHYGEPWYNHRASVRVTMAAAPETTVSHGRWGTELGQLVEEKSRRKRSSRNKQLDRLSMLAVRRENSYDTLFAATHEPYANQEKPKIHKLKVLAQTDDAVLVKVDSSQFTDYAAVSFAKGNKEHTLGNGKVSARFHNYAYLRVTADGKAIARGNWTGIHLPEKVSSLTLNGERTAIDNDEGSLVYGDLKLISTPPTAEHRAPTLAARISPEVVRGFIGGRREATLVIKNTMKETLSGHIEIDVSSGISLEPEAPAFGPLRPGEKTEVRFTVRLGNSPGIQTVPYTLVLRNDNGRITRTPGQPLKIASGPALESIYQHPDPAVYRVHAPTFSIDFEMKNGIVRRLSDDDDMVRLDGGPLFTYSDGKTEQLGADTQHAFVWAKEAPAYIQAHAQDRSRWQARFYGAKMTISMNPDWTQFERTHFTLPGQWITPGEPPRWKRIIAVDEQGRESEVSADSKSKVTAAELEFPDSNWNLAFQFQPPQQVTFRGTEMHFSIGSQSKDNWSIGFIHPGQLDLWRGKTNR